VFSGGNGCGCPRGVEEGCSEKSGGCVCGRCERGCFVGVDGESAVPGVTHELLLLDG
jgi:hypothetical protein